MESEKDLSILQAIIDQDFPDLLDPFVEQFGTKPIKQLDPANGCCVPKSRAMIGALVRKGGLTSIDLMGMARRMSISATEILTRQPGCLRQGSTSMQWALLVGQPLWASLQWMVILRL